MIGVIRAVMGWGVAKGPRNELLGRNIVAKARFHRAVVVDMCSESRRIGSGPRPESAERLAWRICKGLFSATPLSADGSVAVVVAMFDCKERMHEARGALHAARYRGLSLEAAAAARAKGKVVVGGAAFATDMVPYTAEEVAGFGVRTAVVWNRLWSGVGKDRAWELLYDGMVCAHHRHGEVGRRFVMWLRGEPYEWPYVAEEERDDLAKVLCANTHGEGDQRVCEAARLLLKGGVVDSVLIKTIDTDMIVQVLMTPDWGGEAGEPAGGLCLQLKNELVDMAGVCRDLGKSSNERMTAGFWCLACGGVDYCKGLTRFGFTTRVLLGLVAAGTDTVVDVDGLTGTLTVSVRAVMDSLCGAKRRQVKGETVGGFVAELNSIAFCVALFAGASSRREPCGGPVMPDLDIFGDISRTLPFDDAFLRRVQAGRVPVHPFVHVDR